MQQIRMSNQHPRVEEVLSSKAGTRESFTARSAKKRPCMQDRPNAITVVI
jgi:hypothetical protein